MGNFLIRMGNSNTYCGPVLLAHADVTDSSTGANHVATVLKTYTIPANTFASNDIKALRITTVLLAAANTHSKTFAITFGGTTLTTITAALNDQTAIMTIYLTGSITAQSALVISHICDNTLAPAPNTFSGAARVTATEDGTTDIILNVVGTNDSSNTAADVGCRMLNVEVLTAAVG